MSLTFSSDVAPIIAILRGVRAEEIIDIAGGLIEAGVGCGPKNSIRRL